MKVVIDRFEGDFAVCETDSGEMIKIKKSKLPIEAHEGDVLTVTDDGSAIDLCASDKKKQDIEKLCKDLWE